VDSYVRILREKGILRRAIMAMQKAMNEYLLETGPAAEILASHMAEIRQLTLRGGGLLNRFPAQTVRSRGDDQEDR
jgi:hypothetical protein